MSTPPLVKPRHVEAVQIPVGSRTLTADLAIPDRPRGFVIFADGGAHSRLDARNRQLADLLGASDLATLVPDLLTEEEEETDARTGRLRFDVTLLASRLIASCTWAQQHAAMHHLPVGLFAVGSGAGAALLAAAQQPRIFRAVVARGGRPDLAGSALRRVLSPTLLIVGERDDHAVDLNRRAAERMLTDVQVEVVPGATESFEQPGALDRVGQLTCDWFRSRLT